MVTKFATNKIVNYVFTDARSEFGEHCNGKLARPLCIVRRYSVDGVTAKQQNVFLYDDFDHDAVLAA